MTPVETIKAAIVAELVRQNDAFLNASPTPENGLEHLQFWPGEPAEVDGRLDLDALAAAVAKALEARS